MQKLITLSKLQKLAPKGRKEILQGIVDGYPVLNEAGILRNRRRFCYFLAQIAHETAGFKTLREYGGRAYFERRYGHRKDLGNRKISDGPRYRGRGFFQLTGRYNYQTYGKKLQLNLENQPHLAARPDISLRIAIAYWQQHNLSQLADKGLFKAVTRKINGGYNGLRDRRVYLGRAFKIWSPNEFLKIKNQQGSSPAKKEQEHFPVNEHTQNTGFFENSTATIRQTQQLLSKLGFSLKIDGLAGPKTRNALKRFQKLTGLVSTGQMGLLTSTALSEAVRKNVFLSKAKKLVVPDRHQSDRESGIASSPLPSPSPSLSPSAPLSSSPSSPSSLSYSNRKGVFRMNNWKNYLQSRTIWASLVGLLAMALNIFGFSELGAESQKQLVDAILRLIEAAGFIGAAVFRVLAKDRLTLKMHEIR